MIINIYIYVVVKFKGIKRLMFDADLCRPTADRFPTTRVFGGGWLGFDPLGFLLVLAKLLTERPEITGVTLTAYSVGSVFFSGSLVRCLLCSLGGFPFGFPPQGVGGLCWNGHGGPGGTMESLER